MTDAALTTMDTQHVTTLRPITLPVGAVAAQTVAARLTVTGDADGPGGAWADLTLVNAELEGEDSFSVDAQQARELAQVLHALANRLDALTAH